MKKEKSCSKKSKGFTLIEVLVVVLIIGILAAIALPQYQLARDKAEFTKYQAMATSLRDAYDDYVLIHGEGTANFDKLSVSLPDDFTRVYGTASTFIQCFQNNEMFCCMSGSGSSYAGLIDCGKNDLSVIYTQYFFHFNNGPINRTPYCYAKENHSRANRLCNVLGIEEGSSNIWTPEGVSNTYQVYKLK